MLCREWLRWPPVWGVGATDVAADVTRRAQLLLECTRGVLVYRSPARSPAQDAQAAGSSSVDGVCFCDLHAPWGAEADALAFMAWCRLHFVSEDEQGIRIRDWDRTYEGEDLKALPGFDIRPLLLKRGNSAPGDGGPRVTALRIQLQEICSRATYLEGTYSQGRHTHV